MRLEMQLASLLVITVLTFSPKDASSVRTQGVTVAAPTTERQGLIEAFRKPHLDSMSADDVKHHLVLALATQDPFVVVVAMLTASDWVRIGQGGHEKRADRLATVLPFIKQCLASKQPFVRMGGAMALLLIGEDEWLKKELEGDSSFLLIRPEPEVDLTKAPASNESAEERNRRLGSLTTVSLMAECRRKLVEACGRLRIQPASGNLKAIAADSQGEMVHESVRAAQHALAMLEGSEPPTKSGGAEFLPAAPQVKPEIKLKGTMARAVSVVVPPLTPE
jgi:hypothetical protein